MGLKHFDVNEIVSEVRQGMNFLLVFSFKRGICVFYYLGCFSSIKIPNGLETMS